MEVLQLLYILGKEVQHCWVGGWVGLRVSLDILRKRKSLAVPGFVPPTVQSLYQLSYAGLLLKIVKNTKNAF
jgi:hypothetical protein